MIMADVLFYLLLVIGFYVIFVAYWLATEALFPAFVEQCRERYATSLVSSTLIGLGAGLPPFILGFIMAAMQGHALVQMIGLSILFTLLFLALMGSSGLCAQIGRGLPSPTDSAQPWRRVLRGGTVLGLTFLLPVAGWFMVLPFAMISGFGAAVRSIISTLGSRWRQAGRRPALTPQVHDTTILASGASHMNLPRLRP
ncbi:hypothetical protein DB346_09235 [Verrucomicrobia bacterium LW23]|nr:hypothetical protein DB346_09235 [Verrucomicrobia bacterium LW23]